MNKLLLCLLCVLGSSISAIAQNAYFEVQTDKTSYSLGETVNYQIFAWASSGDNAGIALASGNVFDSLGETLSPVSFESNYYSASNGFVIQTTGTWSAAEEKLLSMGAGQLNFAIQYNKGNDDTAHLLASGNYIPVTEGEHMLSIEVLDNMATYWANGSSTTSTAFSLSNITANGADFVVVPEPATLSIFSLISIAILKKRR